MTRSVAFNPRDEVSFVILSCDRYSDLWDPFFGCFDKYWPDCPFKLFLVTNHSRYERPGVSVISIGPDRDYATNLLAVLDTVKTPWIILWVEDYFLTKTINTARLFSILEEAVSKGADYLKLTEDAPLSYNDAHGAQVGEIPRGVKYRSAIGTALYRRETLRKLLIPGMSIWQLDKSQRSNELNDVFMALTLKSAKNPPLPSINSVIKGRWHWSAPSFLRREGFGEVVPGRKRQAFLGYIYIRAYWIRMAIYHMLRRHWYD